MFNKAVILNQTQMMVNNRTSSSLKKSSLIMNLKVDFMWQQWEAFDLGQASLILSGEWKKSDF